MRDLLCADFARLWKNRPFLCCWAGMVLFGLFLTAEEYLEPYTVTLDRMAFLPLSLYGVVTGAFTGLFLGQEHAEGTVRNKLIAGRGKAQVYLSGFFVTAGGALVLYASAVAVTALTGSLLFATDKPLGAFLIFGLLGALCCLSYAALFCLIAMLCRSRAVSVVLCMLLAVVLLLAAMYINLQLTQEEYVSQLNTVTQSGDVSVSVTEENVEPQVTMVPNPHYLTGLKRQAAELLQDVNPTGQAVQICAMNCAHPARLVLCDAGIILFACLTGTALFQRRDLQ